MKNASTGQISPNNRTDWARVRALHDDAILHDEDSPRTRPEEWEGATLKMAGEVVGKVRTRGANKLPVKEQISLRFDKDILAAFRATGRGWQTRINDALREWLTKHSAT